MWIISIYSSNSGQTSNRASRIELRANLRCRGGGATVSRIGVSVPSPIRGSLTQLKKFFLVDFLALPMVSQSCLFCLMLSHVRNLPSPTQFPFLSLYFVQYKQGYKEEWLIIPTRKRFTEYTRYRMNLITSKTYWQPYTYVS